MFHVGYFAVVIGFVLTCLLIRMCVLWFVCCPFLLRFTRFGFFCSAGCPFGFLCLIVCGLV